MIMKAKIKSTGETVNVHEDINGDFVTESGSLYRNWQLEFEKEIDWEQRRYEIAKECIAALMHTEITLEDAAEISVEQADALIAELKKGGKAK